MTHLLLNRLRDLSIPSAGSIAALSLSLVATTGCRTAQPAPSADAQASAPSGASPAQASFQRAELSLADYERMKLAAEGNGAEFEKSLHASLASMAAAREKLLAQYQEGLAQHENSAWTVATYYRIGYLDELFAAALAVAPVPPMLAAMGPTYADQYRFALAQTAGPLNARAIDAFKKALQLASELSLDDEWTHKARESIERLEHSAAAH